jgi:glycerol-3-phosphate acyltransferase PlsY
MELYFKDLWWSFILLAIASYMVGNVNFAIIISKLKNRDITKEGSGNPGTMNMSRAFGIKMGMLILFLDIVKGALPTLAAKLIFANTYFGSSALEVSITAQYVAGFFTVVGHVFPISHNFKGGKGIAATIGVFLVAEPIVTVIFGLLAILYILLTAIGSMGALISTAPPAVSALINLYLLGFQNKVSFSYETLIVTVTEILVATIIAITWYALRKNIKRLLSGEEHETGWLDMIHEMRLRKLRKELARAELNEKNKNR